MFTQRSGSVASYAAVAGAAALVSAVGTWSATQLVASSAAQPAVPVAGQLLTQPLADLPGREVRISLLDREAAWKEWLADERAGKNPRLPTAR